MKFAYSIPNRCPRRWAEMQGDDQKRFCDGCGTWVHASHQYTPAEWEQVWRDAGGKVCGSLPEVSPAIPQSRRAVVIGALLTVISPLMAQSGRVRFVVTDPSGAVIANATTSLLDASGKVLRTLSAS